MARSARRYAAASSGLRRSGLGDDLHQRHAGAVEVHLARRRRLERPLVDELAHVLLEVQALDADVPRAVPRRDREPAVLGERLLVLADLVVLRHVRVVVVLPREAVPHVHRAAEGQRRLDAELDGAPVDDGQRARHALADGTGLGIGGGAEARRAAAEHLGRRRELRVHLEPDDRLVRGLAHGRSFPRFGPRLGRRVCQSVARS